jgi:DNA-binding FadR family transcriptional regulator
MIGRRKTFDFLEYIANKRGENGNNEPVRIPPLSELSKSFGVSIASLREQLEIAKTLGLVEVRPKTGIKKREYSFAPAVYHSLQYAMMVDKNYFDEFSDLRRHVEADYWHIAVEKLTDADKEMLKEIVVQAEIKLNKATPEIPHAEHRNLHLSIYKRIENPFVTGIFEAYWNAYEDIGLGIIKEFDYLKKVWKYHKQIVSAIYDNKFDLGYKVLLEHMDMIQLHPQLKYIIQSTN